MVNAILDDLQSHGDSLISETTRERYRAKWTELVLSKFVAHDIPMGWAYSTTDEQVTQAFLTKYPILRDLVSECVAKGRELCPGATMLLEVDSEPESCHVCFEGQQLNLRICLTDDANYEECYHNFDEWYCEQKWHEQPFRASIQCFIGGEE